VRFASLSVKTNEAVVLLVGDGGPPPMVGAGGATVSTVHS
jgi:hypothetical protein